MKNLTELKLLTIVIISAFLSCSKKEVVPIVLPPPVILPDTLSEGWSKQVVGGKSFTDIFFLNNSLGYVIEQSLYKTTDGGVTWDSVTQINGYNLSITPNGNVFSANSTSNIYKSEDAGKTFQIFNTGSGRITDIYFTGNDTGYTVNGTRDFLRTVDGGINWIKVSSISTTNINNYSSVYFINATHGWVTLGGEVYKINADGATWTKGIIADAPTEANTNASVFAPSVSVVYMGSSNGGQVYKSTNGGLNFSLIKTLTGGGYLDLHFINNEIGYACFGHRIYKTTDGGVTWQVVVALGNTLLVELHFTDASHGWACGRDGSILRFNG